MFTELFDEARRSFLLCRFQELGSRYPAIKSRLVFGTDWHMLATQPRRAEFDDLVREFVTEAFGSAVVDDLMRGNFLRFAALVPGGRSRRRIESFYGDDQILISRMGLLDTYDRSGLAKATDHVAFCTTQSR
jgi:hypothetical protein